MNEAIEKLPIASVVALYAAADKYLLPNLKDLASSGWLKRFCDTLSANRVENGAGFVHAREVLKTIEVDMKPLAESIAEALRGRRQVHNISVGLHYNAYKANPEVFHGLIDERHLCPSAAAESYTA